MSRIKVLLMLPLFWSAFPTTNLKINSLASSSFLATAPGPRDLQATVLPFRSGEAEPFLWHGTSHNSSLWKVISSNYTTANLFQCNNPECVSVFTLLCQQYQLNTHTEKKQKTVHTKEAFGSCRLYGANTLIQRPEHSLNPSSTSLTPRQWHTGSAHARAHAHIY